jgi:hypothetical protein
MSTISGSNFARRAAWLLLFCAAARVAAAAEAETNAPAPPVTGKVNFERDIQPIFALSCLRCHGPEKPRSHFRLDDRASALAGGNDNTNDVVPGHSRDSLLLNYVAREVPDMEMPPAGRGDPLTPRQIRLLRAWIDQGADWGATNTGPQTELEATTEIGGIAVHGNESKFRELENTKNGTAAGVENFSLHDQLNPDEKLSVDGHVQAPNQDYRLNVALDKTDLGFIHAGFQQWRKYYDDSGGYNALALPPEYNQNQDLYVDDGRLWADFGLTPLRGPQITLGYEYQYKQGNEPTLDWGSADGKNLYPATQSINENTHILKLDVSQDINDWHLADSARIEFYGKENKGLESNILLGGPTPDTFVTTQDSYHDIQGMNTVTVNKQVRDWWYLSGGMYYTKLAGSDFFNQTTLIPSASFNAQLSSQSITLRRESEIFSVASLFTPLEHLSLSVGSQNEWTKEEGFGSSVPDLDLGVNTPASSHQDTFKASQNAGLHYNQIPYTVLFAEAQFSEESVSEFQAEDPTELIRQTDAFNLRRDVRAGFNTSPWHWFSFSTQYHNQASDTDYNNLLDVSDGLPASATNGYPAYIINREIDGNGVETKLVLRPATWLSATLTGNLTTTDYRSKTDSAFDLGLLEVASEGGVILDGRSHDQTWGLSTTLTPSSRVYFTGALTLDQTRLSTADNGDLSVMPYHGNIYTVSASATYALNAKTGLSASYVFTRADYAQNNDAAVLPLGLDFTRHQLLLGITRRFSQRLSGALHYEFSQYAEPGVADVNNFSAQGVFASITYSWR